MTVYNINLGIGWASSGVEYAQAYRAKILQKLGIRSKFIFMEMFQSENLEHFTANLGFEDQDVIWLYSYFTDIPIAPSTYNLQDLLNQFPQNIKHIEKGNGLNRYHFENLPFYINVSLCGKDMDCVQRVEFVSNGKLIQKDYYTSHRLFSEYYSPIDEKPILTQRTFFNQNGSIAYEEILQEDGKHFYHFTHKICRSRDELIAYFFQQLNLKSDDLILLDRATGIGQAVLQNKKDAKLAVVIHAEHYNVKASTNETILWNNYYEYQFTNAKYIDAFIVSTEQQNQVLSQQFKAYTNDRPKIYTIPVGSLKELQNAKDRKDFAILTGSRLANEKHIDWLVKAVILAHKNIPSLQFDIYGEGGTRAKLQGLIDKARAENYIRLKGHQNLNQVYQHYSLYLTASTSEGFGLTLLEAVGSGLPLIGLDVPYGNQTFIKNGENGYLIERQEPDNEQLMARAFAEKIICFFKEMNQEKARLTSYQIAEPFLEKHLIETWQNCIKEILNDTTF